MQGDRFHSDIGHHILGQVILIHIEPSRKMYQSRFKRWGWSKNKPRQKGLEPMDQQLPRICPVVPPSSLTRLHVTLIQQFNLLLLDHSELEFGTWGPGPYGDSSSALSVADVIQGNLLVRRKYTQEGFRLIRRGFQNLDQILRRHTLCAMLDIVVHLHRYCDRVIIRTFFKQIVSLAKERPERGRRIQASLQELLGLSYNPIETYRDSILETQFHIYNEIRRQHAHQEPSLLATMAAGVAPYLSEPPWCGTDWKDFLITSLEQMRISLRNRYGVHHPGYHSWLWRQLGRIRNICGEESEAAFKLAVDISNELGQIISREARLLPECWLTMGQYQWKQTQQRADGGCLDWERENAIQLLHDYTKSREAAGATNDAELGWLRTLQAWQTQAGHEDEATITAGRCAAMITRIGALKIEEA